MKYFLMVLLVIASGSLKAQVLVNDIKFDHEKLDFGELNAADGKILVEYNFRNEGPIDFIISDIDVACGCTQPRVYKKRIAPGDSGQIVAEFNPHGMVGDINKWIHVRGNFKDAPHKELTFSAVIFTENSYKDRESQTYYPGQYGYLLVMNPILNYGELHKGDVKIDSIKFFNDGYEDYEVSSIEDLPPYISPLNLPLVVKKKELAHLLFEINTGLLDTIGPIGGTVHVKTNDRFYQTKEFNYSFTLSQDFGKLKKRQLKKAPHISFDKTTIEMGSMKSGTIRTNTVSISNTGKSTLKILRTDVDCTCAVLEKLPTEIAPGEVVTVNVRYDSIFREGLQRKGITIYTNDPLNPISTLTVRAVVD